MNEGKSFFMIAFEVIIAAVFLGLIVYVGTLNSRMWSTYEQSEQNKAAIEEYASYAAFDNAEVGGQDIVSFITAHDGDPFVLVLDKQPTYTVLARASDAYTQGVSISFDGCHSNIELQAAVQNYYGSDISALTTEELTTLSPSELTMKFAKNEVGGVTGNPLNNGNNGYANFKSYLVYDDKSSTVLGIVAVKQ